MTTDASHGETNQAATIDLDVLIRDLDAGMDELPEAALRQCQQHSELVTPRLIETIEEATRLAKAGTVRQGNAHFFALFLLTEFRAKQALPAILESMALPEAVVDGLYGGAVTETFRHTLAVLGEDHPDLIESLAASGEIAEYVRWAAAGAIALLVREGKLTRDDGLARLLRLLRSAVESRDMQGTTIAVTEIGALNPLEHRDEIEAAFEQELVDELMIDWDTFTEYDLDPDRPGVCTGFDHVRPTAIDDTVEELRRWHCFSEKYRQSLRKHALDAEPIDDQLDGLFGSHFGGLLGGDVDTDLEEDEFHLRPPAELADTFRKADRHVGRNDPCPCGSGKKFKKCCLRRNDE